MFKDSYRGIDWNQNSEHVGLELEILNWQSNPLSIITKISIVGKHNHNLNETKPFECTFKPSVVVNPAKTMIYDINLLNMIRLFKMIQSDSEKILTYLWILG